MGAERVELVATDGVRLEAEVHVPEDARAAVLLCHPHPLYGGTMFDGVPDVLFTALPARAIAALRFNFRGVGASTGTHDKGGGERLDVAAAVAALAARATGVPLVVAGWSFGADVSLGVTDELIAGWAPIAPPLSVLPAEVYAAVGADPRPKLLLSPEHDQYNPPGKAAATTAAWVNTEVVAVPGADHFLWGHGAVLVDAVEGFVGRLAASG